MSAGFFLLFLAAEFGKRRAAFVGTALLEDAPDVEQLDLLLDSAARLVVVVVEVDHFVQHVGRQPLDGRAEHFQPQKLRVLRRVVGARPAHDVTDDAEIAAAVAGPVSRHRSRRHVAAANQEDDPPNC
jgi:hypothetical protein